MNEWDLQEIKSTLYKIEYRMKLDQEYHQELRAKCERYEKALWLIVTHASSDPMDNYMKAQNIARRALEQP